MIDPRSLIGMTEGAKKRAARYAVTASIPGVRSSLPRVRRHMLACFHAMRPPYPDKEVDDQLRDLYERSIPIYCKWRWLYRVGERLRLCLACPECDPNGRQCRPPFEPWWAPCDGSGVVRKAKLAETWQGILQDKINDICTENGYSVDLTPRVIIKGKP